MSIYEENHPSRENRERRGEYISLTYANAEVRDFPIEKTNDNQMVKDFLNRLQVTCDKVRRCFNQILTT